MAKKLFKVTGSIQNDAKHLLDGLAKGWKTTIYVDNKIVNEDNGLTADKYGNLYDGGYRGERYRFMYNPIMLDEGDTRKKANEELKEFIDNQLKRTRKKTGKSRARRTEVQFENAGKKLGELYVDAVKSYILELKPSEIPNRKTDNPNVLIDTGTLYDSIASKTTKGGN